MSLTLEEVKHIAHLARLELSAEELELYRQQLDSEFETREQGLAAARRLIQEEVS